MAKVKRIADGICSALPLRVTRRKARRISKRIVKASRLLVRCGCCQQSVEIYTDYLKHGDIHANFLEINGVHGTVDQWRKLLLPLLGIKVPKE